MRKAWAYWRAAWRWNAIGASHSYFTAIPGWWLDHLEVENGSWNQHEQYCTIEIRFLKRS